MATILLVDFDPQHGPRLSAALLSRGHSVPMVNGSQVSSAAVEKYRIDLIVVNLTHEGSDPSSDLSKFCHLRKATGLPVPILCFSGFYRGPSFELRVENLGARLVYAE